MEFNLGLIRGAAKLSPEVVDLWSTLSEFNAKGTPKTLFGQPTSTQIDIGDSGRVEVLLISCARHVVQSRAQHVACSRSGRLRFFALQKPQSAGRANEGSVPS